eukprot:Colp12_sorted_trinity150504_noHs@26675
MGEKANSIPWYAYFGVFFISWLAYPICWAVTASAMMNNGLYVFLTGVIICCSVVPLTWIVLLRHVRGQGQFFYVFTVFAFTAIVDLFLALSLDGYSGVMNFYLEHGEVYLATAHGTWINYYDGTVHFVLYLLMTYAMLSKTSFRYTGLFWVGSIFNSMIVLLGGAVTGRYGDEVKPSFFLNVPYAFYPLLFGWQTMQRRVLYIAESSKKAKAPETFENPSILSRPMDFIFMLYLIAATMFGVFRTLVVLGSPLPWAVWWADNVEPYLRDTSGFPLVQMLVYGFFFTSFYLGGINALLYPRFSSWFPDWAALHAGAALQAQFSFTMSSLHVPNAYPDALWRGVAPGGETLFFVANIALAVVPQLLALRACAGGRDADFFRYFSKSTPDTPKSKRN